MVLASSNFCWRTSVKTALYGVAYVSSVMGISSVLLSLFRMLIVGSGLFSHLIIIPNKNVIMEIKAIVVQTPIMVVTNDFRNFLKFSI